MEAVAKLRNYPTSPRKMRLLADMIRGQQVEKVLSQLEFNPKHPAVPLRKLVLSAISNWKQKNEGGDEVSSSSKPFLWMGLAPSSGCVLLHRVVVTAYASVATT